MHRLTPKDEFLATDAAKDLPKLLDNPTLRSALIAAFAEFSWNLTRDPNPTQGLHANAMRVGATQFLETLANLAKKAPEPSPLTGLETEHPV